MKPNQFHQQIINDTEHLLNVRENEGRAPAMTPWQKLDAETASFRNTLPLPMLDLLIQVEFLMEDDPTGDIGEARRSLYLAKASLSENEGR